MDEQLWEAGFRLQFSKNLVASLRKMQRRDASLVYHYTKFA